MIKKPLNYSAVFNRNDRIRTCGLIVPNDALYQTEPHSDTVISTAFILYEFAKIMSRLENTKFRPTANLRPVASFRPAANLGPATDPDTNCAPSPPGPSGSGSGEDPSIKKVHKKGFSKSIYNRVKIWYHDITIDNMTWTSIDS